MNVDAYTQLLRKQNKFNSIENLIDSFKERITEFNEDKKITTQITIEVDEGGVMYIDYMGRVIRVLFVNNFDSARIDFYLELSNKYNNGFIYDKVVSVVSDHLGNVKSKEVDFSNQLFKNVYYDVLNYIIEYSCTGGKKELKSGMFDRG